MEENKNAKNSKSYHQSASATFTDNNTFEKLLKVDKVKRKIMKRKTITPKQSTNIISFKRYSKTLSEQKVKELLDMNHQQSNISAVLSELSEENFSAFSGDSLNSSYSYSVESTHNLKKSTQFYLKQRKKYTKPTNSLKNI